MVQEIYPGDPQHPRLPNVADMEAAIIREQQNDIAQNVAHQDQIRADAINAVLRAKGIGQGQLLTAYEAAKVFTILSHLEDLAGYSG